MASVGRRPSAGKPQGKKLTIKPFKSRPQLPPDFETTTWARLQEAVVAVHEKRAVTTSKEDLYRAVEDLCVHKMSSGLYEKLRVLNDSCTGVKLDPLLGLNCTHAEFLAAMDAVWQDHCQHMLTIRNVFLYLDRSFVLHNPGLLSLWDLGLEIFRGHLRRRPALETRAIVALLAMVDLERQGQDTSRSTVKRLLRMLSALGMYRQHFEAPFLEESTRFFSEEGVGMVSVVDAARFLAHVEERLQQAGDMVEHYLDEGTRKPLMQCIEASLLQPHTATVVERGFEPLMDADRVGDLRRMHALLSRVGDEGLVRDALSAYVRQRVSVVVRDEARDKDMVEDLLAFQARVDAALEGAFLGADAFRFAVKSAFESSVNERQGKPAELLAAFVDRKLRGEKGVTDEEVEAILDRVMVVFRYLSGKDTFEAFYKKKLARRLLLGKSASADLERAMVGKLKAECGSGYSAKLEGMFADVELSKTLMAEYARHVEESGPPAPHGGGGGGGAGRRGVECSFHVLTNGFWPAHPVSEMPLPPELVPYQQHFQSFYLARYQGRRIAWQQHNDRCIVTARMPRGRKELEVSLFQAVALLCFNTAEPGLTLQQLLEATRMEAGELRRTLQSLACGPPGTRVLVKEPKGKDVNDGDAFRLNESFTSKLFRVKINSIQLKDSAESIAQTHEDVSRDRQYQIDAAVVRIMKARKTLAHQQLVGEVMQQLRFVPLPKDIKARIHSLIEREYLERSPTAASTYVYLA